MFARTVTHCCRLAALLFLFSAAVHSVCGAAESTAPVATGSGGILGILLTPGTKVRVDAPGLLSSRLVGTVVALRTDTLDVAGHVGAPGGKAATWAGLVPLSAIDNLERSNGSKGHTLVGMGIGLFAGVAIANAAHRRASGDFPDFFILGEALAGLGGAILGGIIGVQFRTEKWEKVPVGRLGLGTSAAHAVEFRLSRAL